MSPGRQTILDFPGRPLAYRRKLVELFRGIRLVLSLGPFPVFGGFGA